MFIFYACAICRTYKEHLVQIKTFWYNHVFSGAICFFIQEKILCVEKRYFLVQIGYVWQIKNIFKNVFYLSIFKFLSTNGSSLLINSHLFTYWVLYIYVLFRLLLYKWVLFKVKYALSFSTKYFFFNIFGNYLFWRGGRNN